MMDFVNSAISWLESNWGVTIFGTMTVGTVATTVVLLVKQWMGNTKIFKQLTADNKEYKSLAEKFQSTTEQLIEENEKKELRVIAMESANAVIFDGLTKLVLASKLDSEDKASFIAGVERTRLMKPAEIAEAIKTDAEQIAKGVNDELKQDPMQTVFNVAANSKTLLDKYKKGE